MYWITLLTCVKHKEQRIKYEGEYEGEGLKPQTNNIKKLLQYFF